MLSLDLGHQSSGKPLTRRQTLLDLFLSLPEPGEKARLDALVTHDPTPLSAGTDVQTPLEAAYFLDMRQSVLEGRQGFM